LRDLHLEECGPVNLLVGGNNSGKTSILEAVLLLASPVDPRQWEGAVDLRTTWPLADVRFGASGVARLDALEWLFPHGEGTIGAIDIKGGGPVGHIVATAERIVGEPPGEPIVSAEGLIEASFRVRQRNQEDLFEQPETLVEPGLVIDISLLWEHRPVGERQDRFKMVLWETGRSFRGRVRVSKPRLSVAFASPISHRSDGYLATRVSRLLRAKKKHRAIALLQQLDAKVVDLVMVSPEDFDSGSAIPRGGAAPSLHVEYEGAGLVPVHAMGDGMRRALHFAVLLAEVESGGVLLIDEIEVGMHTSVLRDVFNWLCQACRDAGVQVFATTHSLEAVDAMLEGIPDEDLVLYRIRESRARRFSGELLRVSRAELGQEVR